jgi:aerobic-type carbon monoxide dehydrogenase small subunit (CoxS/CutS family)
MKRVIKFKLNGDDVEVYTKDNITMLDFLRKEMHLTGTKRGCEEGECGACTIMLDGKPVTSCLMLAVEADGHEVTTIEGLMKDGHLHPVQKEFIDKWEWSCPLSRCSITIRTRQNMRSATALPAISAAAPDTPRSSRRSVLPPKC